jgi:plastocyanin
MTGPKMTGLIIVLVVLECSPQYICRDLQQPDAVRVRFAGCKRLPRNYQMVRIMKKMTAISILVLFGLLLSVACNKKENTEQSTDIKTQASSSPAATAIDPATVATVTGKVKFDGAAPAPSKIDMSQDPACQGVNQNEDVVVNNGTLANVFVYVKEGLGSRTFSPSTESDNQPGITEGGCKYHPHVIGLMVGQSVVFVNNDQTQHTIHAVSKVNDDWKELQPAMDVSHPLSRPQFFKNFAREEIMLPVQCDRHPWMKMYVNVVKSPFYDVTDTNGNFDIVGLPPGNYTVAFVHEKLGELDQQVTLAPNETKTLDETFKSGNE